MDIPAIHWIVSPPGSWEDEDNDTIPRIEFADFTCETRSSSESSRASSLEIETKFVNLPTITFNDDCESDTSQSDSLSDDFPDASSQARTTTILGAEDSQPASEKIPSFDRLRRPKFERSLSYRGIRIRLSYPSSPSNGCNAEKVPKSIVMNDTQHFQVLIGSVAQSLSIAPESVDLWISVNSQEMKLSPIASPRELGFSDNLKINVRLGRVPGFASNDTELSMVGNRIPGTKWVRGFPTKVHKCGLPTSPSQSKNTAPVSSPPA